MTPEEEAINILVGVPLENDHRAAQFVYAELKEKIERAIAAAVAAEREACAKRLEEMALDQDRALDAHIASGHGENATSFAGIYRSGAAAIRARRGAKGEQ